jgi:hypothetical protein
VEEVKQQVAQLAARVRVKLGYNNNKKKRKEKRGEHNISR